MVQVTHRTCLVFQEYGNTATEASVFASSLVPAKASPAKKCPKRSFTLTTGGRDKQRRSPRGYSPLWASSAVADERNAQGVNHALRCAGGLTATPTLGKVMIFRPMPSIEGTGWPLRFDVCKLFPTSGLALLNALFNPDVHLFFHPCH